MASNTRSIIPAIANMGAATIPSPITGQKAKRAKAGPIMGHESVSQLHSRDHEDGERYQAHEVAPNEHVLGIACRGDLRRYIQVDLDPAGNDAYDSGHG